MVRSCIYGDMTVFRRGSISVLHSAESINGIDGHSWSLSFPAEDMGIRTETSVTVEELGRLDPALADSVDAQEVVCMQGSWSAFLSGGGGEG